LVPKGQNSTRQEISNRFWRSAAVHESGLALTGHTTAAANVRSRGVKPT